MRCACPDIIEYLQKRSYNQTDCLQEIRLTLFDDYFGVLSDAKQLIIYGDCLIYEYRPCNRQYTRN